MKKLQECDFVTAANLLKVEVAVIKAVAEVEAPKGGFLPDGQVRILFERHKFHQHTKGKFSTKHPDISNSSPGGYVGEAGEHKRLAKAVALDRNAALISASWGKFQIMGENWDDLGYDSLQEFINAMHASELEQLMAFVKFIKVNKLADELQRKDWAAFAYRYNGKNYAINKYDKKMAAAYKRIKG